MIMVKRSSVILGLNSTCFLLRIIICQSEYVKILNARVKLEPMGIKYGYEAELSFLTEEFGFVNDEYLQQSTTSEFIIKEYLNLKQNNEIFFTKITQQYFSENSKYQICNAYLSDPIFYNNGIIVSTKNVDSDVAYELKPMRFNYFSRSEDLSIKVIRCPVLINKRESLLYFQEFYYKWKNRRGIYRGRFVFNNRNVLQEDEIQTLELLMYSGYFRESLPEVDDTGVEVEVQNISSIHFPTIVLDTLTNMDMYQTEEWPRAFGKKAETMFLMGTYGFIDFSSELWISRQVVSAMERMKKGYEVDSCKMEMDKTNYLNNMMCNYYNERNHQLGQYDIFPQMYNPEEAAYWVIKSVQFPFTSITPGDRKREILKCRATFGEYRQPCFIYLLPIHYKDENKPTQLITFMNTDSSRSSVHPFLMSPILDTAFGDGTNTLDYEGGQDETEITETFQNWDQYSADCGGPSFVHN